MGFSNRSPHTFTAALAVALTASGVASAQVPAPAPPPETTDKTAAPIDVSVEGERAPRAVRDRDVASYVVRGDGLKRPGATALDALAFSPGIQGARSGAGSDLATVSIRGAPSAELPVYLAGIRLNDDVTGAADLSTVPLFALDRIEIYRGNAPADADRLGIGGAIFFEPKLPRGTRFEGSLGAGSFGALSFGAAGSLGDERGGALFSFARQSATNDFTYTDDRRTADAADDRVVRRENGDATTYDAWALGRVALPDGGRLVLLANVFAREQGVVGTSFAPAHAARSATQREIAAASVRLPCARAGSAGGEGTSRCAIEITSSAIAARRSLHDPSSELGLPSTRVQIAGERWQESLRLRARIGDRLELGGGAFVGLDRLSIDPAGVPPRRAARLSITGSVDAKWEVIDHVTLFALGGGECHTPLGVDGGACAAGGPAGRAGIRWAGPFGIELVASAGSYVRVPTLGELYGLSGTVQGNAELAPESGSTGEMSARWTFRAAGDSVRGHVEVTGFARSVSDLIVYQRTGPGTVKPFNVADARVVGVELVAGANLFDHVRGEVSLTALEPRDVTAGRLVKNDLLPYHAKISAGSSLELYTDLERSLRMLGRVALGVHFRYRSARVADPAGVVYLAEQRNLGFDASAGFWKRRLTVRFAIDNALDVSNDDILGFALAGRAYHGSLETSW